MTQTASLESLIHRLGDYIDLILDSKKYKLMNNTQKAFVGLISASFINLWTVSDYFDDKSRLHPLAGAARFIVECYADAQYLSVHESESEKYLNAQKEYESLLSQNSNISDIKNYITGKLGSVGALNKKTISRVNNIPEKKIADSYSILCCYTHPNLAAIGWNYKDSEGAMNKYFLYIAVESFFGIINLMKAAGISLDYDRLSIVRADIINNYCTVEKRK